MNFCNKTIYYDGKKATDKNGTLAGSTSQIDTIVKRLLKKNIDIFKLINNTFMFSFIIGAVVGIVGYKWYVTKKNCF